MHVARLFRAAPVVAALAASCAPPQAVVLGGAPAPAASPACALFQAVRRDTLVTAVFATTGFNRSAPPAVRTFREDVLRTILANYSPPEELSAPMVEAAALPSDDDDARDRIRPRFDGELIIIVDGNGRVSEARMEGSADARDLMPGLVDAALRADSARGLPPLPAALSGGPAEVRVRIFASGSRLPKPTDPDAAVFHVAEPRLLVAWVQRPALAIAGAGAPRYPVDLKSRNIEGTTTVEFIVDSAGRAVVGSVRTVAASDPGFTTAVVEAMPRMRFIAGRIDGCPVASWVRQKFEFRLGR